MIKRFILKDEKKQLTVVNNLNSISTNNYHQCIFAVRGKDQLWVDYIANQVKEVYSKYSRGFEKCDCSCKSKCHYVYLLTDNSEVFYIGVGIKDRSQQHLRQARSDSSPNTPKNTKIKSIVKAFPNIDRIDSIVHICDHYDQTLSKVAAHAIENFLIRSVYGSYYLSNDTKGDYKQKGQPYEWIVKPKDVGHKNQAAWKGSIDLFLEDKELKQAIRQKLVIDEIAKSWKQFNIELTKYLSQYIDDGTIILDLFDEKQKPYYQDSSVVGNVIVENTPVLIQLKASEKENGVCFNLRKRRDQRSNKEAFLDYVSERFNNEEYPISNIPNNPFLKLYTRGESKRIDTYFDFSNLNECSVLIVELQKVIKRLAP